MKPALLFSGHLGFYNQATPFLVFAPSLLAVARSGIHRLPRPLPAVLHQSSTLRRDPGALTVSVELTSTQPP